MTTIATIELTEKTATTFLTGRQLSVLVPQVQKGDHRAIEEVYEAFKPLIAHLLWQKGVREILGEDAENTAWLFFWEAVMRYQDEDYATLPGLLKFKVRFALLHAMQQMLKKQLLLILDGTDASGRYLWEPAVCDVRLEAVLGDVALHHAMRKLSAKQREIVLQTVLGDLSLKEYSEQTGICYSAAYKLQRRALAILKKYL